MTSKEKQYVSPQIDATFAFDPSLKFANGLMDRLLERYTLKQIVAHTGISERTLCYFRDKGITRYPQQLTLQIMAGDIQLVGDPKPKRARKQWGSKRQELAAQHAE